MGRTGFDVPLDTLLVISETGLSRQTVALGLTTRIISDGI